MDAQDILVIGAGPAGLAVSACLRAEGLPYVLLEREQTIAASWRRHYDRLHLHTTKHYSALPFSPWPPEAPTYPSRDQLLAYLQAYALQHRISPRLGVEVHFLRRVGERFAVETSAGSLRPRFVVVATGANAVPVWPDFPGLGRFAGPVIHARDYRNALPYLGKRTLVVGCGNSGAEIALDLAEQGVDVAMVVRGPVHVVPRDLLGRPSQATGVLLSPLPLALRDALTGTVLRLAVGDLSRWGMVRPRKGVNRMIEEQGRIPMLDLGTIAQVKAGRIRVLPGVTEVLTDRVRFEGGSSHPFDAVVLATGYRPGLEGLIEGFGGMSDRRGRPLRFGEPVLDQRGGLPGLFFVGFRNPATGALREMAREAPRVAALIRRSLLAPCARPD